MNTAKLYGIIDSECERIKEKFSIKNVSYGQPEDGFYNFRETARRMFAGIDSPGNLFAVAEILVDKHNIAIAKGGINTPELRERLIDRAVYSLIQLAMLSEEEQGDGSGGEKTQDHTLRG